MVVSDIGMLDNNAPSIMSLIGEGLCLKVMK